MPISIFPECIPAQFFVPASCADELILRYPLIRRKGKQAGGGFIMKKIVLIGSGHVATVLGRKFHAAGHSIVQILSRNSVEASRLAYEWDTESANYLSLVNPHADVYLIAVTDTAIPQLVNDLRLPGKVVAHTAASVSMEVLKPVTEDRGIFYPLQSLRKESSHLPEIPLFTEGATPRARQVLAELAASISPTVTTESTLEYRQRLHVAAVVVNNFTNYLYQLAEDYCRKEQLDFQTLLPLMEETVHRLREQSPAQSQTGPALRGDEATLNQHLHILEAHPRLQEVYAFMTRMIREQA